MHTALVNLQVPLSKGFNTVAAIEGGGKDRICHCADPALVVVAQEGVDQRHDIFFTGQEARRVFDVKHKSVQIAIGLQPAGCDNPRGDGSGCCCHGIVHRRTLHFE